MKRFPIATFLAVLVAYGAAFFTLYHRLGGYYLYLTAFMWSPGLAALTTIKLTGEKVRSLGWGLGSWRYQFESYVTPILYVLVAYGVIWKFGLGGFYDADFVAAIAEKYGLAGAPSGVVIAVHTLFTLTFGVITYMGTALGEEIGWRGFLVPELAKKFSLVGVGLTSGIIWAVWHYPLLLGGGVLDDRMLVHVAFFTTMVVALSFIMAWIRLTSGSIWTAVILHATHNLAIQRVANPLTFDTGNSDFYLDETGLVLPVVVILVSLIYVLRPRPNQSLGQGSAPAV